MSETLLKLAVGYHKWRKEANPIAEHMPASQEPFSLNPGSQPLFSLGIGSLELQLHKPDQDQDDGYVESRDHRDTTMLGNQAWWALLLY